MNDLVIFTNEKFGEIRTIEINNEPWFVGKDVAEILGYANTRDALATHVEKDDKNTVVIHDGNKGNPNQVIINESGLYSLIFGSKLDTAKEFKHWVTHDVLPAIRKTGSYTMPTKSQQEINIEEKKTQLAEAEYWRSLGIEYSDNKTYKQILDAYSTKAVAGKFVLPLPSLEEENFSATEAGKKIGISANKFGSIAKKLGIKINGEYGKWYIDKAQNSGKEVNTFRYTQKAIDAVIEELNK